MQTRNVIIALLVAIAAAASAAGPIAPASARDLAGTVLPLAMGIGLAFSRRSS